MANTVVTGETLINGTPIPAHNWSVEVNAYSIASSLEATMSSASAKGFIALPDYFALAQSVRPLPFAFKLGLSGSASAKPQMLPLESGYVDEIERDHNDRQITFVGRGAASLFQDVQITAPILKNSSGSAVIQKIFAQRGIPLTVVAASPQYSGKTNNTQTFDLTMRGRTQWDVMQAIAVNDGFRLTVHNNKGTYGPFGLGDPVMKYYWGRAQSGVGILELTTKHSPRRSHNIKVNVRSYIPRSGRSISASYGQSSAADGEVFDIAVEAGLTSPQLKVKAEKVYEDIAKREFLVTMTVVPDAQLVSMVSQYGSNFSIQLGGDVWPSEALKYEVRQIRFEFSADGTGALPLLAKIVMGNINPIQAGGFVA